jgi:ABC-2 type transport system permease protein
MPWLDPAQLGPPRLLPYLWALLAFALPTLLVTASGFFALAIATRSLMWTYVGAVALLVLFVITRALLRDPAYDTAAALADPFGFVALNIATKYWTAGRPQHAAAAADRAAAGQPALWRLVSGLLLALAYRVFRMDGAPLWRRRPRARRPTRRSGRGPGAQGPLPAARPAAATRGRSSGPWMRFDAASVFRSPAFFVLMAIGIFNAWGGLWFASRQYGTEVFPVTRLMVQALQDSSASSR